ncbi:signal peptidase I [Halorubrum sp. SD612]|uniref:signal peptidase I n=1 Tax=Halorubrum sp. SD612 TaxID=1855863 RepID=UPI000A2E2A5B|nr:signal peptidase I [Halorubrum sp. SD612]OTF03483.1 signal peptidase I [Halorubrum sp. SD612]
MTTILTSSRTKRAANVLGIVLLIALVAPFAVYAAPEVVGADESFVVLTASMTPAIAPGDVVIVAERDPTAVAEGDVVTFVRGTGDVPVTHRVIDVVDDGGALAFETMGDANEGPDPGLVPAGSLVGVVTLTIPWIGYVVQFAGTQIGFVALVLLPFGLLAVTEVWSIVRDRDASGSQPPASVDPVDGPTEGSAVEADASEPAVGPEPAVGSEPAAPADAPSGSGGVSVDAVGGATAVLAGFAPYAAYVAFQLRTAAAIAVAVATATLLLGALAAWVPASGVLDRSRSSVAAAPDIEAAEPNSAADGGESESAADADESGSEAVAAGAERAEPEETGRSASSAATPQPDAAGEGD